jgi:DNA (cytosine-5)-methyltransferase 1
MRSVELFSGAGGLALATSLAGFKHEVLVEWNKHACSTLRTNRKHRLAKGWNVYEGDIGSYDFSAIKPDIDLLAGGPPCQPFSIGGKHKGMDDSRNLFPQYFRAVRALKPKALIVENVRGLTRKAFSDFFNYIQLSLTYPEIEALPNEDWEEHYKRIKKHDSSGSSHKGELTYRVLTKVLNAADFGAPQQRFRVFFVGFRSDIKGEWSFPSSTHSHRLLYRQQWETGEYWDRHSIERPRTKPESLALDLSDIGTLKPWVTVRDALADLPQPTNTSPKSFPNHILQLGAKTYPGHTGSPLDEPSKALKAGVHGVPGGENMIAYPDGSVRYYTVREACRIQTFPDDYLIDGAWSEAMRQLGNAVPVTLGATIARSVARHLKSK